MRNTARSDASGFDPRWGHGLVQPAAALSVPAEKIAAIPGLVSGIPLARADSAGKATLVVSVENTGVLDAAVRVALARDGKEITHQEAVAVGLDTIDVTFPAKDLPAAGELKATLEPLGMTRPRVYDDVLEVDLRVHSGDLRARSREGGRRELVVPVENRGSVDAQRVGVIVYRNEPAPEVREGGRSHMVAARIISVPASGSAEAVFEVAELPGLENLWVEIEQLDVGAPHVAREHGKAQFKGASVPAVIETEPVEARTIAEFRFDAGEGKTVCDWAGSDLRAEIDGAKWTKDGEVTCLAFDGKTSQVTVADHESLAGMRAMRIDVRVRFDQTPGTLEPLVYKWLSGHETASFGLGLLNGHPYVLLRTKEGSYVECQCGDLTVGPGAWHTVTFLYDGGSLTAEVDGKRSEKCRPAYGRIDSCKQPLRIGAATDKQGNLVSFAAAKIASVTLRVPKIAKPDGMIPGELRVGRVVRLLVPDEPEDFFVSVPESGEVGLSVDLLDAPEDAKIEIQWRDEAGQGGDPKTVAATLTRAAPRWKGRLDKGVYRLRVQSKGRIVYRLDIQGADDVWQTSFHATDRGAGATADYTAWLSTKTPGKHVAGIFDCSEGARLLFLPEHGSLQETIQTGGVMGDSSSRTGGRGLWREHAFQAGPRPCGAWFFYPSKLNASGDYAIRGDFTIHWRKPPEEIAKTFADSPTMRAMAYTIRGGGTTDANRAARYQEAIAAGLGFMEALTDEVENGTRILERWMTDRDGPRVYWGNDGQMLCARTYECTFSLSGDEKWRRYALGIGRRVISRQLLDKKELRYGALPYGLIGSEEKVSWGSSNNIQGKILYGLAQLAASSKDPKLLEALKLNADYYVRMQYDNGRWAHYVERAPKSMCGYPTAWGVSGLLIAYETLGDEKYLTAAEHALKAYVDGVQENEGLKPDGSIVCWCTHAQATEDNHEIRSSLTMLTPYALAYRITKKGEYAKVLDELHRFLTKHQDESGVIKYDDWDVVNLIYSQNWGPQGFCEAYEATGDTKFLRAGLKLADFFVRVQVVSDDPHYHGAWVGSFNVAKDFPGGNVDDEGNLYDLYTSWGAGPIVYGLQRLLPHVKTNARR